MCELEKVSLFFNLIMDNFTAVEAKVAKSRQNSINDEENVDGAWQDLVGIAPDPPDRREKCENCL